MGSAASAERPMFDVSLVTHALPQNGMWSSVTCVEETGSTNDDLRALAQRGADHGSVFVAEHQTAGRGRLGRQWEAPPRSALLCSVLLRPPQTVVRWGWVPLVTALAVNDALRTLGVQTTVKWPNDILWREAKLAGILAERVDTARGTAVIVGIGVNIDLDRTELPSQKATSLRLVWDASRELRREQVLVGVLHAFAGHYQMWVDQAWPALHEAYVQASSTVGRAVEVSLPGESAVVGEAVDIDAEGRLVVKNSQTQVHLAAGDVTHVRLPG